MSKVTTDDVDNVYNTNLPNKINQNFARVVAAMENTLSRDGTGPNQMNSDLDMNGFNLLNVGSIETGAPVPINPNLAFSPLTYGLPSPSTASDLAFAQAFAACAAAGGGRIDLGGFTWYLAHPWIISYGNFVEITNGQIRPLASSSDWAVDSNYVVSIQTGAFYITLRNIRIDGLGIASCFENAGGARTTLNNVDLCHQRLVGHRHAGGGICEYINVKCHQWLSTDPQLSVQANRTAIGLSLENTDAKFIGCHYAWCGIPLQTSTNGHHGISVACHFYNGSSSPGIVFTNPQLMDIHGYKLTFTACYIDTGIMDFHERYDFTFSACVGLYNSATAVMPCFFRFNARKANDVVTSFSFDDSNNFPTTIPLINLVASGSNSWASDPILNTITQNLKFVGSGLQFYKSGTDSSDVIDVISSHDKAMVQYIGINTTGIVQAGAIGNDFGIMTSGIERGRMTTDGKWNVGGKTQVNPNGYPTPPVSTRLALPDPVANPGALAAINNPESGKSNLVYSISDSWHYVGDNSPVTIS